MNDCSKQPIPGQTLSLRTPRSLDELLNYRLLRLYAVSGAPVLRLLEGRYGISRREWRLLALLATQAGLSPSAIADLAHLDRPRASRGVAVLVQKGLAHRSARAGDARHAVLGLTPAGQALYDELFPQIAALNSQVLQAVDDATVQALDQALTRLTDAATALNAEAVRDVRADRRAGGSRAARQWPAPKPHA